MTSVYRKTVCLLMVSMMMFTQPAAAQGKWLRALSNPVVFKGDSVTAYRDPAVYYYKGVLYLYFTLVKTEANGRVYSYTAMSYSKDCSNWQPIKILTARDQSLDFSSPGNIIRYKNEWFMCLQTYPRPDYTASQMPRFGTGDARLYLMRSSNLTDWSAPELMLVKGAGVPAAKMGRMIDPYLLEDKDEKGKWWCFYKQNGVSMSYSYNLRDWQFFGYTASGENACVLVENNEYILFHSPKNGIAIRHSPDLKNWRDTSGLITLGQQNWPWASGRISAGAVINLTKEKNAGRYLMFFHGSGPLTEEQGDFDKNASIGIAWSKDLLLWDWPGKQR
ncbi:MAG: hypothetical protein ABIU63_07790 [Chitinophagaceae bacterium]